MKYFLYILFFIVACDTDPTLHKGSCKNWLNTDKHELAENCLKEMKSRLENPILDKVNVNYIEFSKLKNIQKITPDLFGRSLDFYSATFKNQKIFIKLLPFGGNLDRMIKKWEENDHENEYAEVFSEVYWAQKLFKEALGPDIYGLTLIKKPYVDLKGNKMPGNFLAIVSQYIDGKTYKNYNPNKFIFSPPLVKPQHIQAVKKISKKFNKFAAKHHLIPFDIQYMVDKQNRGWVIDTGGFPFPIK